MNGVASRQLPDRALGRVIEDAWAAEIRSPSKMMQELASGLRQAGLNIFRHRRGMLFVSPIRIRAFGHERTGVSGSINAILQKVTETPGINRKQLAEQLSTPGAEAADLERTKRTLITDLHWLVHEGYVIEFNDGTLDLPRPKPPAGAGGGAPQRHATAKQESAPEQSRAFPRPSESPGSDAAAEPQQAAVADEVVPVEAQQSAAPTTPLESEGVPPAGEPIEGNSGGGMSIEQSITPVPMSEEVSPDEQRAETGSAGATETETAKAEIVEERSQPEGAEVSGVPSPS